MSTAVEKPETIISVLGMTTVAVVVVVAGTAAVGASVATSMPAAEVRAAPVWVVINGAEEGSVTDTVTKSGISEAATSVAVGIILGISVIVGAAAATLSS
jgi:hypothetical protein